MKLSNFKRINKEDFTEEERPLIERLGGSINNFAQELFNLFNKNITIQDNLLQELKVLEVIPNIADATIPSIPLKFRNELKNAIKGINVINVENLTNSNVFPLSAVQVMFSEDNKIVTINKVTGLQVNNKYRLTLLTYGG